MRNRLNELKEDLPKTREAINILINCIASHYKNADDNITSNSINELTKLIREELKNE